MLQKPHLAGDSLDLDGTNRVLISLDESRPLVVVVWRLYNTPTFSPAIQGPV